MNNLAIRRATEELKVARDYDQVRRILLAAFGSHDFKWKEAVLLAIGLVLLVLAVFIWGLKLTIPIYPAFMQN